jgi:MATE family multidrug resistance protein
MGNWVLIWGHLGVPAVRASTGSAWATGGARASTMADISAASPSHGSSEKRGAARTPFAFDATRCCDACSRSACRPRRKLTLEVGVFAAVSALAGTLDPVSLGAHQIALNIAALAFMVPLGLSSAAAVRVGHAVGAGTGGAPSTPGGPRSVSARSLPPASVCC